ncbi:MAG TPA: DUF2203 domain-containing protein [Acidimicrobiales bacterium]|jgi:hypothetical protein
MAYFSEEEARAYLPRLRRILSLLKRSAELGVKAGTNGHATVKAPAGADDAPLGIDPEEAVAELEEKGIILRDPVRGLVDFPALHPSGKVVLLCWLMGEDDLGWWHLPEDGFAGRRPLPVPPEL